MKKYYEIIALVVILAAIGLIIVYYPDNSEDSDTGTDTNTTVESTTEPESTDTEPTAPPTPLPTPENEAVYEITFDAVWSEGTHPDGYISSAHFSPFIAYNHDLASEAEIFADGKTSTPGVKLMAETGQTSILEEEINTLIDDYYAYSYTKGARIDSPGSNSATLSVSSDFRHLTLVSMIAPSPDWFVSALNVSLVEDGKWIDEITLDTTNWDAGTDSGPELDSADQATTPAENIAILSEPAGLVNSPLVEVTIKRVE